VGLAKAAQALKIPIIVTTTTERMWGPMIPELQEALAGIQRIERTTVNAWDDSTDPPAVKRIVPLRHKQQLRFLGSSRFQCKPLHE
jgi:hypothetical protein